MRVFLFFCSCLLLTACQPDSPSLLGSWRAVDVRENGDSLQLDPGEISFEFHSDNRYAYRSTLNYREAGTWRYENGYLYAQDTTGQEATQYVVAVDLLRQDSLLLRMKADSAERKVLLLRE
ncbi:lipocalin-like domain-containing protein [Neolewinella antarctica]|uniref:Lipocalin-like domain-containing protein n=1 Tax=Neolewinella antarctica TaxID=442734 RepID=A0ABX0XA07_9BACT|nr:lipocalin family protein [Neolewinella antarctica]NJC26078.1 hypothetical protein [Neolewinella antarctica]